MTMEKENTGGYVPVNTEVLNTEDGEPGRIIRAALGRSGRIIGYDVATGDGFIERWKREDFVPLAELEAAIAEDEGTNGK